MAEVVTQGVKNCKKELLNLLSELLGKKMAKLIIYQKMAELEIADLDNTTEYAQKVLIDTLFGHNMMKILDEHESRDLKLVLLVKLFGEEKAKHLIFEDIYIKCKIPVNFFKIIFGKILGNTIIGLGEKKLNARDVKHLDEHYQLSFMDEVLKILFKGFPKKLYDDIRLAMVKYIKDGELDKFDTLEHIINNNKMEPKDFMKLIMGNLNSLGQANMKADDWMEFISKCSKDDKRKLSLYYEIKKQVTPQKAGDQMAEEIKNQNLFTDLKLILSSYMSITEAENVIKSSMSDVQIQKLTESAYEPSQLIDSIVKNSIISEFSPNKITIVKDKLRSVLLK